MRIQNSIRVILNSIFIEGINILHGAPNIESTLSSLKHIYSICFTGSSEILINVSAITSFFEEVHRVEIFIECKFRR
ncbi:hypothetical protein D3C78_1480100 [compost metagenome]